jgi:hypothetical protein
VVKNWREVAAANSARRAGLWRVAAGGNVPGMLKLGRFLQFAALVILPLAMMAQLTSAIDTKMMLRFLFVGVGIFTLGWLMQRYSGGVGYVIAKLGGSLALPEAAPSRLTRSIRDAANRADGRARELAERGIGGVAAVAAIDDHRLRHPAGRMEHHFPDRRDAGLDRLQ